MSSRISPWVGMAWSQVLLILVGVLILSLAGCSRAFYRQQADQQVRWLVDEKARQAECGHADFSIHVDPQSRMFDPFCPDHSPMPPDDPVAHRLMHCVDCKKGYPCWHANGDTRSVDNPEWKKHLPVGETGVLTLNADQAVRVALLNSTSYQRELETLYLSALDVTAERFSFDKQYFSGHQAQYTVDGRLRTGSGQSSSELALSTQGVRVEQMFTTGASLVAGLANSIVWELSGPDTNVTSTLLDFTFVQPLLRRAGRDRIMETLTLSERTLLANVRAMERFRRGFYLEIVTGRDDERGPTRRGGFFGTSGLAGFTGVGAGGFGGVGGGAFTTTGGGGGFGAGAGQAEGFIGLLQRHQNIRNQQANIAGLRSTLQQLEETLNESLQKIPDRPDEILRQRLQIAQAHQALLNAQSRLLNTENLYQASLDGFKIQLGLPPQVCVQVEDPLLDQFQLVDDQIVARQNAITELQQRVGRTAEKMLDQLDSVGKSTSGDEVAALDHAELDVVVDFLQQLSAEVIAARCITKELATNNIERALQDVKRLRESIAPRRRELMRLQQRYDETANLPSDWPDPVVCQVELPAKVHPSVFDVERLEDLSAELDKEIHRLAGKFDRFLDRLDQLHQRLDELPGEFSDFETEALYKLLEREVVFALPGLLSRLAKDILDLSLLQARARTQSIRLTPVDIDPFDATEIARACRRDWKNARASLVDAWRLIEFNADDLESTLDLTINGDVSAVGDNPVKFRSPTGRLRMSLAFDAPLTRLLERNNYRQSLIEYQQAKRSYYRFEDRVAQTLRATIRRLELNQLNFEQQRLAVVGAIDQVVLNDEIFALSVQRGENSGATAARDVVSALADLQDAQNNFLSVWVDYEVLRRGLDVDLGTMRLDEHGLWIDPGPIGGDYSLPYCNSCQRCCHEPASSSSPAVDTGSQHDAVYDSLLYLSNAPPRSVQVAMKKVRRAAHRRPNERLRLRR